MTDMTDITYITGDATQPGVTSGPGLLIHLVNDAGRWGAGFVLALQRAWPHTETAYRQWHTHGVWHHQPPMKPMPFGLGQTQILPPPPHAPHAPWVAQLCAQHGTRSRHNPVPLVYEALQHCLHTVRETARTLALSVHAPRLGAGLAGGDWPRIAHLLTRTLLVHGVPVTIYDWPATRCRGPAPDARNAPPHHAPASVIETKRLSHRLPQRVTIAGSVTH